MSRSILPNSPQRTMVMLKTGLKAKVSFTTVRHSLIRM